MYLLVFNVVTKVTKLFEAIIGMFISGAILANMFSPRKFKRIGRK